MHQKIKIDKITASPLFGLAVIPTPADVQIQKDIYVAALVASDDGTVSETEAKNVERVKLEELLTLQAQNVSEISAGDLVLYLTSGYEAKDTNAPPIGVLPQVLNLRVVTTESIGELSAVWDNVAKADNYTLRCYTDEADPAGSLVFTGVFSPSKAIINELPSGRRVFVQVAANGTAGQGAWSDPVWDRPR